MTPEFRLHKIPGKKVKAWQLDLRAVGRGRPFFRTRDEALLFSSSVSEELRSHGAAAFTITHKQRLIFMEAERKLAAVNAHIDQAVDFYIANHKAQKPSTLRDAIDNMEAAKVGAGRSKRYKNQLCYTLNGLAKQVGEQILCADLSLDQIKIWLNNPAWSLRTRQGYLIDLRTFVKFCRAHGYMALDPTLAIESIEVPRKRPGILTPAQCEILMEAARKTHPTMLAYLTLGLFCGIRQAEIFRLRWHDIDIKRAIVTVESETSKTKSRRIVDLSSNAAAWLKFGGELPPSNWQDRLDAIREKAKIPWPHDCLRHSFCSYHLAQHQSADKTALQAGHSPQILFEHYRELVTHEDAAAFWKITPA